MLTNTVITYRADGRLLNLFQWDDTRSVSRMIDSWQRYAKRRNGVPAGFCGPNDLPVGAIVIWARTEPSDIPSFDCASFVRRLVIV